MGSFSVSDVYKKGYRSMREAAVPQPVPADYESARIAYELQK